MGVVNLVQNTGFILVAKIINNFKFLIASDGILAS